MRRRAAPPAARALVSLSAALFLFAQPGMTLVGSAAINGTWTLTGSMKTARFGQVATPLNDGMVLVTGGQDSSGSILASAELYDPGTGTWSLTGSMNIGRADHTATRLPNGEVLVAGGETTASPGITATAELYDPGTGAWSMTGAMNTPRFRHHATLLLNGTVLVEGGINDNVSDTETATAEIYDPATMRWTHTGSLNVERQGFTATRLGDGMVLVVGGQNGGTILASAEIYNPSAGTWSLTGSLHHARAFHTATTLVSGVVLVAGGRGIKNGVLAALTSTERYNPGTGTWSAGGPMNDGRFFHIAILVGREVLVAGGFTTSSTSTPPTATAELYNPATMRWTFTGSMHAGRAYFSVTELGHGMILVAGGGYFNGSFNVTGTAEIFQ